MSLLLLLAPLALAGVVPDEEPRPTDDTPPNEYAIFDEDDPLDETGWFASGNQLDAGEAPEAENSLEAGESLTEVVICPPRAGSRLWSDSWFGCVREAPEMELAYIRQLPTRAELRAGAISARRLARAIRAQREMASDGVR